MPVLEGLFDADEYQSDGQFTRTKRGAMPAGEYRARAIESEVKETKKGDGKYVQYKFVVTEQGSYNGNFLWINMNVVNPNQTAQRIGNEQLANFCRAVGKTKIKATEELHDKDVTLVVAMVPKQSQTEPSEQIFVNEIRGFKAIEKPTLKDVSSQFAAQLDSPF